MINKKINLYEKFKKFSDHWSPKVIAEMNDYQFKLAKIKGEFIWHNHKDTDEVFMVINGKMKIEFQNGAVNLSEGELYVVPAGIDHKPYSEKECLIMLIEPKGVINTGDSGGELTINEEMWI